MQPEVVSDQTVRGRIFAVRGAESEEGAVLQEDQMATGPQEPHGLGDPAVGIAPYARAVLGDGEIEARVGQRDLLGVAVQEREAETVLSLEPSGRLELLGRVVDATMRAPRRASQADQYAVPQPSSMTSLPATSGTTWRSRSGTLQIPHVGSSLAQARWPRPAYSTLSWSQCARLSLTCSGRSVSLMGWWR